jgi:hypothetical protein
MLKPLANNTIFILLLVLANSQSVCAGTSLYRYDGKMPFIRMMLGMMDAMGVIDKLPANGRYGGNPYSRNSNNPMLRSPWLQSPWTQSGQYGSLGPAPIWGSPDWGVLPLDRYTKNYYKQYGYEYSPSSHWSQSDLDGWVEEPWEVSQWNSKADNRRQTSRVQPTPQPRQQPANTPVVQNFNFGAPEKTRTDARIDNRVDDRHVNRSPLAKLSQPRQSGGRSVQQPAWQPDRPSAGPPAMTSARQATRPPVRPQIAQQGKGSPLGKRGYQNSTQKPCVTEFCGLKKPNLNGLWVSQSGEMLGINNHRYLWSDGSSRYLTGQVKIQNEYLTANVDDHEQILRFKYKLAGNHLLTMQPDGTIREFVKMSRSQYQNFNLGRYNQNYGQNNGQSYGQNFGRDY